MKNLLLVIALVLVSFQISFSKEYRPSGNSPYDAGLRMQVSSNGNNIGTWVWNTGVFNQDMRTSNTPGFEWPRSSGKFAMFTTGLSTGAYINGELRLASVSYTGEYAPGYVANGVPVTNSSFKLYKIVKGDDANTNPDYANWGLMVPYGAPYVDVDMNGQFNPAIDKPGVKNAQQTIFVCMTDGFPENHTSSEGFSGGTDPMLSEMHFTTWSYNVPTLEDVQYMKIEVINKNSSRWDSTFFAFVADPDLGDGNDDYIGCDLPRNLGYCYNSDNADGTGTGNSYGANPPAVGIDLLKGAAVFNGVSNVDLGLTSFVYFTNSGSGGISCEQDPSSSPAQAYNYLRGVKRDGTPWVNPQTQAITKFCYPGDPETNAGWSEYTGSLRNCDGVISGITWPSIAGDRRFVMSSGSLQFHMNPGDTQKIVAAQFIARGSNNKNSVTKLKQMDDIVQNVYDLNFPIDISYISSVVPDKFSLYQNYPNPFNPTTNIKFDIIKSDFVSLKVFDINGREVANLVNENLKPGTYEANFSAGNLSSGIYFYQLKTSSFVETKRMSLIK